MKILTNRIVKKYPIFFIIIAINVSSLFSEPNNGNSTNGFLVPSTLFATGLGLNLMSVNNSFICDVPFLDDGQTPFFHKFSEDVNFYIYRQTKNEFSGGSYWGFNFGLLNNFSIGFKTSLIDYCFSLKAITFSSKQYIGSL